MYSLLVSLYFIGLLHSPPVHTGVLRMPSHFSTISCSVTTLHPDGWSPVVNTTGFILRVKPSTFHGSASAKPDPSKKSEIGEYGEIPILLIACTLNVYCRPTLKSPITTEACSACPDKDPSIRCYSVMFSSDSWLYW